MERTKSERILGSREFVPPYGGSTIGNTLVPRGHPVHVINVTPPGDVLFRNGFVQAMMQSSGRPCDDAEVFAANSVLGSALFDREEVEANSESFIAGVGFQAAHAQLRCHRNHRLLCHDCSSAQSCTGSRYAFDETPGRRRVRNLKGDSWRARWDLNSRALLAPPTTCWYLPRAS